MTTDKRGRENPIHQWGTPAPPAVDTAQIPNFLMQEPLHQLQLHRKRCQLHPLQLRILQLHRN
eukprot:6079902-Ditylum_brightwellii.AAC.2